MTPPRIPSPERPAPVHAAPPAEPWRVGPRAPAPRPLDPLLVDAAAAAGLTDVLDAVEAGRRLDVDQGLRLFHADLGVVGALADRVRERLHGDLCFYNRNLHINATNVCEASCIFCSFARLETGDPAAWTLSMDQAVGRLTPLQDVLLTEVHIVNGLNPDLPFDYYTTLMQRLKQARPDLHCKGFTAVEIHYYAEKYGMTYEQVLRSFVDAGLGSMPGGGAEIFADRARRKLCHDKVDADGWLEVHRVAHRMGIKTNSTMLFGSIETLEERVDHLDRLRRLQDESIAALADDPDHGFFQTFIALRFHNENNRLQRLRSPTHLDSLRTIAVARLMLDNLAHIKAYWPMLGEDTAQLAQDFGADDMDGTVREEHIYHMAGADTPQGLAREDLFRLIGDAGRRPVERDTLYRIVSGSQWSGGGAEEGPPARIAAVGYHNAWPLIRFLEREGGLELREGHPYQVAGWLSAGEVDLALLPVGALLTDPELRVVPDVCVGADGAVQSVLIVAETPPERWTRVVLDGVSRTSVLLARLLLTEGPLAARVPAGLEIVEGAPGSGVEAARGDVAAVVIGDVARALPARLTTRVDLAAEWKAWTGLPFVFAVWAGRPDVHPAVVARVRDAGLHGIDAVREWAATLDGAPADHAGRALDPAVAELDPADAPYLTRAIRHRLDDAAMMGLRRFAALAHRAGLVPLEDVSLYAPPADRPAPGPRLSTLRRAARARVTTTELPYRLDGAPAAGERRVERGEGETAASWLRRVAETRLSVPAETVVTVDVGNAGLAATAAALLSGAGAVVVPADLQIPGCVDQDQALVELERHIEDAGFVPVRVQAGDRVARAALSAASRHRPLSPSSK
ncbi:MAG: aminofutalosine synthase MqnE [Alphaproteobacteria bacterium]|nr:aminofutalosine synthase MqnE [Alphaproteobacteria bacterium]